MVLEDKLKRAHMRPKTPNRIQPRRLLLSPKGSPVPSVLSLSSTKAMAAGLDMVAAAAAANKDAPIPRFELLEGFSSMEHLTLPTPELLYHTLNLMVSINPLQQFVLDQPT